MLVYLFGSALLGSNAHLKTKIGKKNEENKFQHLTLCIAKRASLTSEVQLYMQITQSVGFQTNVAHKYMTSDGDCDDDKCK